MTPIKLDLRTDLAKLPEHVVATGRCLYTAPCVVGMMMTPEQRDELAKQNLNSHQIAVLARTGAVEILENQLDDFRSLQRMFDGGRTGLLNEKIAELREKYK